MTDDRLLRTFGTFDAPAEPDVAFADRLFDQLATDLGFRPAARPAGSLGGRVRRALGLERLPVGRQALRLAYLAAVLGLLIAGLGAALFVASQLLQPRPSPVDLVRLSQGAYDEAPAVRFTIHTPDLDAIVTSDGHGTWRSEVTGSWGDAPGSYALYDGERVGWFDGTLRTWSVVPLEDGGPPYPFNHELTWTNVDYPGLKATLSAVPCDAPTDLGEDVVAGRTADHVGCPTIAMEYWLDRETRLVLRVLAREGSPYWAGPANQDTVAELATFELLTTVTPSDFAWEGPPGAYDPGAPLASTVLVVGARPPAWEGRTTGGTAVESDDLPTPAAVFFFAPGGCDCDDAYADFVTVAPGIEGLTAVIVGSDDSGGGDGLLAGYVMQHPTEIPVVADPGAIAQAWGINPRPAIVLLAADGTVAGMHGGIVTRDDLERVLAAAAGGQPIPSVAPAPSPTATPGDPSLDPSVECTEDLVTCLPIGSQMPEWSAPLLAGGTLTTAELDGKPTVMWFQGAVCDGPCPDWFLEELQAFAALAERDGERSNYLMIAPGSEATLSVRQLLEDAGVDFPVVLDEDSSITDRFHMIVLAIVVFDADGRLVAPATTISDVGPIVDRLLASPAPSTSP